jgi:hypothetical protein
VNAVCWKWATATGYRSSYGPETVNILARMVRRHYADLDRFICVTDDGAGLDPDVDVLPAWNDYADLPSPAGRNNPSCYRRLRAFAPDIGAVFGERFVSLDLDVLIASDLRPLWDRPEDFVIWGDTNPRTYYNGSMVLMTAGARSHVWTEFDPVTSPQLSRNAGHWGSDQGWISYRLGPNEAKWTTADGVYSFRNHLQGRRELPANARCVVFHGHADPWHPHVQRHYPWVVEHYH